MQKTKIVLIGAVAIVLGGVFVYFFGLIRENGRSNSSVAVPPPPLLPTTSLSPPAPPSQAILQGKKIVYLKRGMEFPSTNDTLLISSNFDGSEKEIIQRFPDAFDRYNSYIEGATVFIEADISYKTGKIVYVTSDGKDYYTLWLIEPGAYPKEILTSKPSIGNAVLSSDGEMVAYMADQSHLRMIRSDGRYDTPLINDVSHSVKEDHPYQFVPFAWSFDKSKIYMRRTTDLPATEVELAGTYVVDVEKKEIQKVSNFTAAVSPDGSMFAYVGYTAKQADQGDGPPMVSTPPFTLNLINIKSGEIKKLAETQEDSGFFSPIWSDNGKKLAYMSKGSLSIVDIQTLNTTHIALSGSVVLQMWMDDRIFYKENTKPGYGFAEVISSVKVDGTGIQKIDSEGTFDIVGATWHY